MALHDGQFTAASLLNALALPDKLIPRLPIGGWQAFAGAAQAQLPCILDAPHLVFTTSGRAAIAHALRLLGVGDGDSVLAPTYHCPTMIAPITGLGARPVFYPVSDTGFADLDYLKALATANRPRAIIAAHYFGFPQPMAALRKWCDQTGIALIEDCAHCLFGTSDGRTVGQWGDYAIASLTKFLPLPEGGCLVVNRPSSPALQLQPRGLSDELRAALDVLESGVTHRRLFGLNTLMGTMLALKRQLRATPPSQVRAVRDGTEDVEYASIDYRQAGRALTRVGTCLARRLPRARIVAARRANYMHLGAAFADRADIRPLLPVLADQAAPYVFPLWVNQPDPAYERLRASGIPVFRWNWLWPDTPRITGDDGMAWSHHVFQLPCHQDLAPEDLEKIIDSVKAIAPN